MLQLGDQEMSGFTIEDMRRFAGEAWGPLGIDIVTKWCEFNATYFASALRPVPLVITNAQPPMAWASTSVALGQSATYSSVLHDRAGRPSATQGECDMTDKRQTDKEICKYVKEEFGHLPESRQQKIRAYTRYVRDLYEWYDQADDATRQRLSERRALSD
jgi:hypothetical protein